MSRLTVLTPARRAVTRSSSALFAIVLFVITGTLHTAPARTTAPATAPGNRRAVSLAGYPLRGRDHQALRSAGRITTRVPLPLLAGASTARTIPSLRSHDPGLAGLRPHEHGYQIEYPHWMSTTWIHTGRSFIPAGATKTDVPLMLRHLLRRPLRTHLPSRHARGPGLPTRILVEARTWTGHLSHPIPTPRQGPAAAVSRSLSGIPHNSKKAPAPASSATSTPSPTCSWRGSNRTMAELASDLADKLQAPVADATGLVGPYDYTLTFTDVPISMPGAATFGPVGGPAAPPADASTPRPTIPSSSRSLTGPARPQARPHQERPRRSHRHRQCQQGTHCQLTSAPVR